MKSSNRLIVHIGPGKTGSTAIQRALRLSALELAAADIAYWGATLELAPLQAYSWQGKTQAQLLGEMVRREGLVAEFVDCVARSFETGPRRAIVSNETFGTQAGFVIPLLRAVEDAGFDILVVGYARSPSAMMQSGHAESELKRKNHRGRVRSFAEYAQSPFMRANQLERFDRAFGERFVVRNYDETDDVVADFMSVLGTDAKLPSIRANVRWGVEAELIRAFYNDRQRGQVSPAGYRAFANPRHVDLNFDVLSWYRGVLPTQRDVDAAAERSAGETKRLNALLARHGQPLLQDLAELSPRPEVSPDRLAGLLLQIVYSQHMRLSSLEDEAERTVRQALPPPKETIEAPRVEIISTSIDQDESQRLTVSLRGGDYDSVSKYEWSIYQGVGAGGLSSRSAVSPRYTAESVNGDATVGVRVSVTVEKTIDGTRRTASAGDTDTFRVIDTTPSVDAPSITGVSVPTLNGGESKDWSANLSGGTYDSLCRSWSITQGGAAGSLSGANRATPTFTANEVDRTTNVRWRLVITARGNGNNARDGDTENVSRTGSFNVNKKN